MADLEEVAALLHVHKGLHEYGDSFPNLKKAVMDKLREIEADHAPKAEPEVEAPAKEEKEEEAPTEVEPEAQPEETEDAD